MWTADVEGFTARRLFDAFAERGHEPTVVSPPDLMVRHDVGADAHVEANGRRLDLDGVVHTMSTDFRGGLAALDVVAAEGTAYLNGVLPVLLAADKFASARALTAGGIDVPAGVLVVSASAAASAVQRLGLPAVVKASDGAGGRQVHLAQTAGDAARIAGDLLRSRRDVIVQEFIAEASGTDLRVVVIDGRVVTAMTRTAQPGEFRANISLGATPRKARPSAAEEALATAAARRLGLDVAGVDVLRSRRGPLVLEVNSFPGFADHPIDADVFDALADALLQRIRRRSTAAPRPRTGR